MVMILDEGLYIVVYYKDEEEEIDSQEKTESTSKSIPMGIVPDFWIDIDEMFVLWPPYRTDRRCNLAIHSREKPSKSWIKHDIIKGRFESGKTDYYEALEYLKDCQDNSSGADDLFESKNNKDKRKELHKNRKYSEALGLAPIKEEHFETNRISMKKLIANLPTPPSQALLLSDTSQAANPDAANNMSFSNLAGSSSTDDSAMNNVKQKDSENIDPVKKPNVKGKPKIKESKKVPNLVQKTSKGFVKVTKDDVETEHSAKDGVSNSLTPVVDNTSKFASVEPDTSSQNINALHGTGDDIGPLVSSDSNLLNVLCEIMKAIDRKLNLLIANQNQMIVNQCKEKVIGGNVANPCEEDWLETKTLMRRVFDDMHSYELFLEFDKQIKESRKLRKKVVKYLMEKMDTDNWKLTARLVLNAVMHLNVQQRFSGVGQKGKESLIKTNIYKVLEAIVQAAAKDKEGKCTVNTITIQRYFGKYVKTAKTRAGGYESTKKKKNDKKRVLLAQQLLFDDVDDGALAENDSDDDSEEEADHGPKRKKFRRGDDDGNANLSGDVSEIEDEPINEAEREALKQKKLVEKQEKIAQRSLFDEILNAGDGNEQEREMSREESDKE